MTRTFLLIILVFYVSLISTTSSPATDENDTSTFQTTHMLLRDGVQLAVDYLKVSEIGRFPVILELTPYGRGPLGINYRYEAQYWRKHGYAFVIADCRGTGDSQGEMAFFSREGQDGYDLIEWIACQPWSNGRVAMRGSSYSGTNQWYIAREQSPHLLCITPSATLGRPMEDVPYFNGAFAVGWAIDWIGHSVNTAKSPIIQSHPDPTTWPTHRPLQTLDVFAAGKMLPLFRTFLDHPMYDAFWRSIDFTPNDFARITIPSLAFTGWFDGTMYGTIWRFQEASRYAQRNTDQFLIIGPYTHANAPDGGYDYQTGKPMKTVGDLPVPDNAFLPGFNMTHEFFDWCLKDGPRPEWKRAKVFVTGSNRWITRDLFPPPESYARSLFLASEGHANGISGDGRLQWEPPTIGTIDSYSYNPTSPVRSDMGEKSIKLPIDINLYLNRKDVLVYTTKPLNKSITVIGDVVVELLVSTTARDTDFVIEVMDVMTDDRSIKLGSRAAGQLRARYRNGFDREVFMLPNQTYRVRIELREIGHTFLANHRIRLAIMSSFFPWISANPNTGASIASDIQSPIVANQTIHHTRNHPSRIRMRVVDDPIFDE
jgi:putative CocE/NonD family hydrolase